MDRYPINKKKFREWLEQKRFYQRPLERLKERATHTIKGVRLDAILIIQFLEEQFNEKIGKEKEGFIDWLIRYKGYGYEVKFCKTCKANHPPRKIGNVTHMGCDSVKKGGCLLLYGPESIEWNTINGNCLGFGKLSDAIVPFTYRNGKVVWLGFAVSIRFDGHVFDEYLHSLKRFWCGWKNNVALLKMVS